MKKVIATVVLCAMVVSIGGSVVSCGKKGDPLETTVATTTGQQEETTVDFRPKLPEKDYGGNDFTILVRGQADNSDPWGDVEVYSDGETGEAMNDALYRRNQVLEERYNIKIKQKTSDNLLADARKAIMAQDSSFDVVFADLFTATTLGQESMLVDLKTVPYLQLGNPWWDKSAERDLSIGGKLFFTTGDFSYRNHNASWVYAFNKNMIETLDLENPYELVKSGKWTIDKFAEMLKGVSSDLDGNGKMNEADRYGLITEQSNTLGMFIGAENFVVSKDKEDYPTITINTEKGVEVLGKVFSFMNDKAVTVSASDSFMKSWDDLVKVFQEDRGLFYSIVMYTIKKLRNMPADFGILPMPKYNEEQTQYYTWTSPWIASGLCVPVSSPDLERTGILMEDLNYESMVYNRPAYYDVSLQGKFTRDAESSEMIDIILGNRVYDLGMIYNWGGVGQLINTMTSQRKDNFSSQYEKLAKKAQAELDKTIQAYKDRK